MDSKGNNANQENSETASFLVTKISSWRGKYKRILTVGTKAVTTYNPVTLEVTNQWLYSELASVKPVDKTEFVLNIARKKKRDTMRFTCEHRSELLFELLGRTAGPPAEWRHDASKHHWSGIRLPVVLEVSAVGVVQLEPTTRQPLATYGFHEMEGLASVADSPSVAILSTAGFGRLHVFDVPCRDELFTRIHESACASFGVQVTQLPPFASLKHALLDRFGSYSSDEQAASLMEFPVHKISPRHSDAVKRALCVTDSCLVERDPDTYRYFSNHKSHSSLLILLIKLALYSQHLHVEAVERRVRLRPIPRRPAAFLNRIHSRRSATLPRQRPRRLTSHPLGWRTLGRQSRRPREIITHEPGTAIDSPVATAR